MALAIRGSEEKSPGKAFGESQAWDQSQAPTPEISPPLQRVWICKMIGPPHDHSCRSQRIGHIRELGGRAPIDLGETAPGLSVQEHAVLQGSLQVLPIRFPSPGSDHELLHYRVVEVKDQPSPPTLDLLHDRRVSTDQRTDQVLLSDLGHRGSKALDLDGGLCSTGQ